MRIFTGRSFTIAAAVTASTVFGILALGAVTAGSASGRPGVLLGAHVGDTGAPDAQSEFSQLESSIGRKLAIDNDQETWRPNIGPVGFPNTGRIQWDISNGRVPMLSWMVAFTAPRKQSKECATAADITAGRYDDQLAKQAGMIKNVPTKILIRWNAELGSAIADCFYGGRRLRDPNPEELGPAYVAAWRHIVDVFRKQGVKNVAWVWAPGELAYSDRDGSPSLLWKSFYPGDSYVDWIGVDLYNKTGAPRAFGEHRGFQNFYNQTARLGKPLMLAETGGNSDQLQNPDPQAVWLSSMRTDIPKRYPALKAIVYWNVRGSAYKRKHPEFQGDYSLKDSGLTEFRKLSADPYFKATRADLP